MRSKTMIRALLMMAVSGSLMSFSGRAQTTSDTNPQLTTELVGQRYCTGDADLDGVLLKLRLVYRNTGTSPLILYKGSTDVSQIIVRKTADSSPEVNSHLSWYSDRPWTTVEASSLRKLFVVLQPNTTFETRTSTRVFVTRDDLAHVQGAVESGDHYLQVTIPTWLGSQELADAIQQKWRSKGILSHDAVTSLPMKFTIAKQRTIADCP
ncbi:MAG TPA: hypothetical protein VGD61_24035 [Pyrinomonadaceae bacterium]